MMGLDLLPYLEDHCCLVAHNTVVFKLKLKYTDDLSIQDKSALLKCVSRQAAHDQLEQVLRAVLYILERDGQVSPIQTKDFVVHTKTIPWALANKIEFLVDGRSMHCYHDCLTFEVHCKQSSGVSTPSDTSICSKKRKPEEKTASSKGEHLLHDYSKPGSSVKNSQNNDASNKDRSLKASERTTRAGQHSKEMSASVIGDLHPQQKDTSQVDMYGIRTRSTAKNLALQSSEKGVGAVNTSANSQEKVRLRKHKSVPGNETLPTSSPKTKRKRSSETKENHLSKNLYGNSKDQEQNSPKMHAEKSKQAGLLNEGRNLDVLSAAYNPKSNTLKNAKDRGGLSKSVAIASQDVLEIDQETQNDNVVTKVALDCIKRYRHQRTQSLKCNTDTAASDTEMVRVNCPQKQQFSQSSLNYLEMQDTDIVEIYDNGSIISPSYTYGVHRSKRNNDSPLYLETNQKKHENANKTQETFNQSNSKICTPKKKLYSTRSDFVSLEDGSVSKRVKTACISEQSKTPIPLHRQNLNRVRKLRKERLIQSSCANGSVDIQRSPVDRHKHFGTDVIEQYKKTLAKGHSTQTKLAEQLGNGTTATADKVDLALEGHQSRGAKRISTCTQKNQRSEEGLSPPGKVSLQRKDQFSQPENSLHYSMNTSNNCVPYEIVRLDTTGKKKICSPFWINKEKAKMNSSEFSEESTEFSDINTACRGKRQNTVSQKNFEETFKSRSDSKLSRRQRRNEERMSSSTSYTKGSSVSSSPTLRPRRRGLHNKSRTGSSFSLSQNRTKRKSVRIVNVPMSTTRKKNLRLARNRLLTAKDGVWLLNSGQKKANVEANPNSRSHASKKRKQESRSSMQSVAEFTPSTTSEKLQMSTSSSSLSTPIISAPPGTSTNTDGDDHQEQEMPRADRPSKFWQVMSYFFKTKGNE
ncbi:hypothetical protein PoB_000139800 [Plakobranchus ocellatus]|uniref:HORMA domain-containing protein n=1 Tax=Plakobranchus ocellatus TaxID=259542 RepID=A0AAV3XXB7_9GAST|nr:hypothetical protein PoB_000139800 [Plakobranchus ocellatus]